MDLGQQQGAGAGPRTAADARRWCGTWVVEEAVRGVGAAVMGEFFVLSAHFPCELKTALQAGLFNKEPVIIKRVSD